MAVQGYTGKLGWGLPPNQLKPKMWVNILFIKHLELVRGLVPVIGYR